MVESIAAENWQERIGPRSQRIHAGFAIWKLFCQRLSAACQESIAPQNSGHIKNVQDILLYPILVRHVAATFVDVVSAPSSQERREIHSRDCHSAVFTAQFPCQLDYWIVAYRARRAWQPHPVVVASPFAGEHLHVLRYAVTLFDELFSTPGQAFPRNPIWLSFQWEIAQIFCPATAGNGVQIPQLRRKSPANLPLCRMYLLLRCGWPQSVPLPHSNKCPENCRHR